jgi:hypothetical protein
MVILQQLISSSICANVEDAFQYEPFSTKLARTPVLLELSAQGHRDWGGTNSLLEIDVLVVLSWLTRIRLPMQNPMPANGMDSARNGFIPD